MPLVINNAPVAYSSIHGDVIFTVYNATNVSQAGYKYICDVYNGSTLLFRAKAFPNPVNNNGIFDIGKIIRNYVATQLNPATALQAQEFGAGAFFYDIVLKFGEEYGGTLYTNLLVDSSRRFFSHYNGRLVGGQTILTSYLDLGASNRPYENKVVWGDTNTFIPYLPTTVAAIPVQIITSPQNVTYNTTVTPTAINNLQQLNVSPTIINALFAGAININTAWYTVKIGATSIYKFIVECEPKYTNYVLHFLNQFGGFESMNFQKVSRKTFDVEKKDFTQLPYRIDGAGIVTYSQGGVLYDTGTVYASRYKEKMLLNSDLLSDGQYRWLRELVFSPIIYIEDSGYLVPVKIVDTNYQQKKIVNDKMSNLQINIEFGELYNTQYR